MVNLLGDLRYAWRGILARPGDAAIVVLTLGLGLGATAAIFSAVHALLLRPFPFADPDRLVRITSVRGGEDGMLTVPEQDDIRGLDQIVEDIALYTDQGMYNASGFGAPEELPATIATHNLLRVLGVAPAIGSVFPAEADRSRRFDLVISHALWTRRFGQDPNIVGRTMTLDGAPGYYIHGVLPEGINFPTHSDLFRSSGIGEAGAFYQRRDLRQRYGLARLKRGVSVTQAQAALDTLAARLAADFPASNAGLGFRVQPLRDLYVGNVRPFLLLLFAAVVLVLAVACANVVNLLLSRAIARDRELSVRMALGASRWDLIRQQLVESVMLSLLGGLAGVGIAWAGIRAIAGMVKVPFPSWMTIGLDGATLAFLLGVSIATGAIAGLVAALRQSDRNVAGALKDGSRGSSGARHHALRQALVIAEVALAMVLMVGASLMVQSFVRLQRSDTGFQPDGLLTFRVEMGWRAYDTHQKVINLVDRTIDRLRELPGVDGIAIDSNLPLSGKPREPYAVAIDGQAAPDREANPFVHLHVVDPNYFTAMRAPLVRGRVFADTDVAASLPVAIVSETLAQRLFGDRDPIGQRIATGNPDVPANWATIVGIAAPVKLHQLAAAGHLDVYRPHRQRWVNGFWFAVRTRGVHPASLANVAPATVTALDPDQSFFDVQVMTDRIASGIWQQQVSGALFAAFGGLAFVLAVIGLYGVLSYTVTQQRREIGVRMALGAGAVEVRRMVVGRGIRMAALGVCAGLVVAIVGARLAASLLFGISWSDPVTFISAPIALLATAAAACYIPARRATLVDPLIALKPD
ncbi:MAG TPA: ABC transporter permease [Vicinamibacterales bacterium]|nr:ABC transporter permease [Vicinamibacterales bacterium]